MLCLKCLQRPREDARLISIVMRREDQMLSMCPAMMLIFSLIDTRLIQREYINLDNVDCLILKKV